MKTEEVQLPAITEQPKVAEMIKNSGVEPTKAEAHVLAFADKFAELHELSRPLAGLNKENPSKEDAKIARENRLKVVKVRTSTESIKDDRKKLILAEANLIQSTNNIIRDACILTEAEYEEIEKHQERVEAQARAELKQTRIELLTPYEVDTQFLPLDTMDEATFDRLLLNEKEKFEAVQQLRAKQESERIEAERKAEEERQAQIKAEQERIEAQRIENERLKEEAEAREKELEAERKKAKEEAEAQAKIRAVRSNILRPYIVFIRDYNGLIDKEEAEFQKEFADIKKGAELQWKFDLEEKKKQAQDEIDRQEQQIKELAKAAYDRVKRDMETKAEVDRLAKIEADKKEADKLAKSGDKAILNDFVKSVKMTKPMPIFENENSQKIAIELTTKFSAYVKWALSEIEKL